MKEETKKRPNGAILLSIILKMLARECKVGTNVLDLEAIAKEILKKSPEVTSLDLGYKPEWSMSAFPSVMCIGVNDVYCHGIPTDYTLKEGDLVSLDMGIRMDNQCYDAAMTVGIGKLNSWDQKLLDTTKKACLDAIKLVKPGVKIVDVSSLINTTINSVGYKTNKLFGGHGIGTEMHQNPVIPNVPHYNQTDVFEEGKHYCIEVLASAHDDQGFIDKNGWTIRTKDGRNAAIFEHQIEVTKEGCITLTDHFKEHTIFRADGMAV